MLKTYEVKGDTLLIHILQCGSCYGEPKLLSEGHTTKVVCSSCGVHGTPDQRRDFAAAHWNTLQHKSLL